GRFSLSAKLQSVADEVLEQLLHLPTIGINGRQLAQLDSPAGMVKIQSKVRSHFACDLREIDGRKWPRLRGHSRIRREVVDERLHETGRVSHTIQIISPIGALGLKPVSECLNFAKRLLQMMGGDVREILELAVVC